MSFSADISKWVKKAEGNVDQVVRQAVILAAQGIINMSPVGNPELWAVNADYRAMKSKDNRLTYNLLVDAANAALGPGEKKHRKLGKKRMAEGLKKRHSSYVGGRFRANWNFSEGAPNEATSEWVDPSGSRTLRRIMAQANSIKAGRVFYLTNALPYAHRLEYEGWSSQAPQGMVRITAMDLPRRIEAYAASLK